jgi:hypothetical protein
MRENPWEKELEADRFAGVAARKAGMTLAAMHSAAASVLGKEPSSSHPGLNMRLQALTMGYNHGSPCAK